MPSIYPTLLNVLLKNRQIAYAITDGTLNVIEIGGEVRLFQPGVGTGIGCSLFDIAPELIGNEAEIQAILSGAIPLLELPLVNREPTPDQLIYVNLTNLPYRAEDGCATGAITGIAHLVEDVTASGKLEQKLTQQRNELFLLRDQLAAQNLALVAANTELHNMDELKSRFVSVAAHELRNPLASILGYVELLEEDLDLLVEEHAHCVKTIQRSAHRLLSITNDLLDVTRIESGYIELTLNPVDLATLVEDAANELQPQLEAKRQRLFLDATDKLSAGFCDKIRTQQIITNLLSNAIKYTPEGGEIKIRLTPDAEAEYITISVVDNGIGITEKDQAHLFRSFFRGSNTHETRATGAGLGLNITRSLVELQGGRIWFESTLNQGTTFYFTIPISNERPTTNDE